MSLTLAAYQGRAGDRNDQGCPGARMVAEALATRSGLPIMTIGTPKPALNREWSVALEAAQKDLAELATHMHSVLDQGHRPITALNRCAASIATLPAVAEAHPEAMFVWFDAHGDLNTSASSTSGYLGGMAISGAAGLWDSGFGGSVPLRNVILVGARDLDPFENRLIESGEVGIVRADSADIAADLQRLTQGRPVYVHFDCDVLEPGLVPTDFQVPGGLHFGDIAEAFAVLAQSRIIGLEISEFQGRWTASEEAGSPGKLIDAMQVLLDAARRNGQT